MMCGDETFYGDCDAATMPFTFEVNSWDSHILISWVANILLKEMVGYDTAIVYRYGPGTAMERLSTTGEGLTAPVHSNLEFWPDGKEDQLTEHADDIENAGAQSMIGRSGWYVADVSNPDVITDFWRGYLDADTLEGISFTEGDPLEWFAINGTLQDPSEYQCQDDDTRAGLGLYAAGCVNGTYHTDGCVANDYENCGYLVAISPEFEFGVLQQQTNNLGLNMSISFLGQTYMEEFVRSVTTDGSYPAVLFYYWYPTLFLAQGDYTRVSLPDANGDDCVQDSLTHEGDFKCDFSSESIMKYLSGRLSSEASLARDFLRHMSISNSNINTMLNYFSENAAYDGTDHFDAACEWVKDNVEQWSAWIPQLESCSADNYDYVLGDCSSSSLRQQVTFQWKRANPDDPSTPLDCLVTDVTLPSSTSIVCDHVPGDSTPAIAFGVVASLECVVILCLMGYVHVHRRHKLINRSQPAFLQIMAVGALGLTLSVFLTTGEVTDTLCTYYPVLLSFSFFLLFGSLVVKCYRVWRLFHNPHMKGNIRLTLPRMLLLLLGLVLFDVLLFIIWYSVDTPTHYTRPEFFLNIGYVDRERCQVNSAFATVVATYHIILIVTTCYFAWNIRRVEKDFQESKWIFFAVYNMTMLICVFFPIYVGIDLNAGEDFVVLNMAVLSTCSVAYFLTIVPKIYKMKMGHHDKEALMSTTFSEPLRRDEASQTVRIGDEAKLDGSSAAALIHVLEETLRDHHIPLPKVLEARGGMVTNPVGTRR